MISHEHKCIFIHIPKCAGTGIEKFFVGTDWWNIDRNTKHILAKEAKDLYKEYWDDYFKFSFVRNPWELELSWYFFRKKQPSSNIRSTKNISFEDFVKKFDTTANAPWLPNTSSFLDYLTDSDGELLVDSVGRCETFQRDFSIICNRMGIHQQELPHHNKTKHKHYTEYYDDETRQIVAEKYAKDIEYFGYEFGED